MRSLAARRHPPVALGPKNMRRTQPAHFRQPSVRRSANPAQAYPLPAPAALRRPFRQVGGAVRAVRQRRQNRNRQLQVPRQIGGILGRHGEILPEQRHRRRRQRRVSRTFRPQLRRHRLPLRRGQRKLRRIHFQPGNRRLHPDMQHRPPAVVPDHGHAPGHVLRPQRMLRREIKLSCI